MSLNISLPIELEKRVREHAITGLYGSAREMIQDALRLFEAYKSVLTSSLLALMEDIAQGVADAQTCRIENMDMASIKAKGGAALKARSEK